MEKYEVRQIGYTSRWGVWDISLSQWVKTAGGAPRPFRTKEDATDFLRSLTGTVSQRVAEVLHPDEPLQEIHHSTDTLHPDNKILYRQGAVVEVALAGDVRHVVRGRIVGIATQDVLDHWIVSLDNMLPDWPYQCISVQHTFIRPAGDNRPFLCEGVPRV